METRSYNGFVVVVEAVQPTPHVLTRSAIVTISAHDNRQVTSLYFTLEFRTEKDAETHGFQMAEEWIQSHSPAIAAPTSGN